MFVESFAVGVESGVALAFLLADDDAD